MTTTTPFGQSTIPSQRGMTLSDEVAEEIRAMLGRRKWSQARLARALGQSQMWMSDRLNGKQPIDLNDLQRIARALEISVSALLPSEEKLNTLRYPNRAEEPENSGSRASRRTDTDGVLRRRPKLLPRSLPGIPVQRAVTSVTL